jgi:hypothetical protein
MASEELELYKKRVEQRSKLGYFKFEDGSKSTDPKNAKLVKQEKSAKKKLTKVDESEEEAKEDEVKPPRAKSAYNYFIADYQSKIPEGTAPGDRMGVCSAAWKASSDSERKKYEKMHD